MSTPPLTPRPALPAAGQIVRLRMGRDLHSGLITGRVLFQTQTGPGSLEEAGGTVTLTVGRFALMVP